MVVWDAGELALRARLIELDGTSRAVLDAVASGGRSVPFELLRWVTELDDHTLTTTLVRLIDGLWLVEVETDKFAFRDHVARDVISQSILSRRRSLLHRRAVEYLGVSPRGALSTREMEVARLVAEGKTNPEIAHLLHVSPRTISVHVSHILAKLHVTRRAQIASWLARAEHVE